MFGRPPDTTPPTLTQLGAAYLNVLQGFPFYDPWVCDNASRVQHEQDHTTTTTIATPIATTATATTQVT